MLKEQARFLAISVFTVDLVLTAAAFFLAFWFRSTLLPAIFPSALGTFYPLQSYLPLLPLVLVIWGVALWATGQYQSHRTMPLLDEAWEIVKVCVTGLAGLTLAVYTLRLDEHLLGDDKFSRPWVLMVAVFSFLLLLTEKLALRVLSRYVRSRGFNYRTVLIVGANRAAAGLARSMQMHPYWGFRILGFITHPASDGTPQASGHGCSPILGSINDILRIVDENVVDDVLFCVSRRDLDQMEDLFLALQEQGIRTRFTLNFFPHIHSQVHMEELDGVPLLTFSTGPERWFPLVVKRGLDIVLSALLLLIGAPVVLSIVGLLKLTQGGAVLYKQTRCGLNGRRFTLYKFRTMVEDADEQKEQLLHLNEMDGPVFKLREDPRVTRFGRLLRRSSLDELPQLWNVLRGDMSLVGPRPPIPDEVARYQRWQRRRLSMKPGLTCLWQISGRNQVDFERWMRLDLEYIDSWSPWLDVKILAKTLPAVLSGHGAS